MTIYIINILKARDYITEGYLRGWGITGNDVELDVGTALAPRKCDVERWNNQCVTRIESLYGHQCEAIDVHGTTPHASAKKMQGQNKHVTDYKRLRY